MSASPPGRAARTLLVASLVAVGIETITAFLPWVRTGHRDRTSFEVISAARELDVLRSPLERLVAAAWFTMPLLAALAALAAAASARRAAAIMTIAAGVLGLAIGRGVYVAPFAHHTPLVVCLVVSGIAVIVGVVLLVSTRDPGYR